MTMTNVQPHSCPYCGHLFEAVSDVDGDQTAPRPGDVTVCIECASPLILTEGLQVRVPTPVELLELTAAPEVMQVVQAIAATHRKDS
jgi:hypothetical protein